jgi:pimeloyl-ACP methyl ester carboxylesterase
LDFDLETAVKKSKTEVNDMMEPTMKRVQGNGVDINLAVWEGNSEPVLAIHGITANCRCWDRIAEALNPDFSVMAMDLRGRGLSGRPDSGYSLEHHLKDIIAILDKLNLKRIKVMGHSLGAFITLGFAALHPDRVEKAILVDGAGDLTVEQMDDVFIGIKPALDRLAMTFPSKEAYLEKMRSAPYMQPWSTYIDAFYRHEMESIEGGVRTNINGDHIAEESTNVRLIDCRALYAKVRSPILVLKATEGLFSKQDLLLPEDATQKMTREIRNSIRFDVTGTNHYGIVFQQHEERDKAIQSFLKS